MLAGVFYGFATFGHWRSGGWKVESQECPGTLDDIGLPGELLEFELTEGILMRDIERSIKKVSRLRERGLRISIDDSAPDTLRAGLSAALSGGHIEDRSQLRRRIGRQQHGTFGNRGNDIARAQYREAGNRRGRGDGLAAQHTARAWRRRNPGTPSWAARAARVIPPGTGMAQETSAAALLEHISR
jgi:hypothetical protein